MVRGVALPCPRRRSRATRRWRCRGPPSAPVPWGRLLRLPAVWAIIVGHFASNWGLYVLLASMPTYFKSTFGVSLASAGVLSAAPSLVNFVAANVAGAWADRMLQHGPAPATSAS